MTDRTRWTEDVADGGPEQPVVRDRRRIDPETGALREQVDRPAPAAPPTAPPAEPAVDAVLARAKSDAAERLEDLQRLQAEYRNYRRRVERDRETVRDIAVSGVLSDLLPVLDDVGRAREHGDLTGAFKVVGESLEGAVTRLGLQRFGAVGDPFDPTVHEALAHAYSDQVEVPTCVDVLMVGYRFGDRVLRPARVAVAEPSAAVPETFSDDADKTED